MKMLSAKAKTLEWHEVVMECAGRAGAATALSGGRCPFQIFNAFRAGESGVALRLPSQSKTRWEKSRLSPGRAELQWNQP
jgi:hypothetical protein